jgi:4-hydroxy-tetrahydrodipicolinate synthase
VLYNVPGRTGCDLQPETVAELAGAPRIVAIKEARSEPERMAALLRLRGSGFTVLSGDDPTACRAMLAGADGVVSVASNVLPAAFRRLCDLARAGRRDEAEALDARMQSAYDFLGVEPNPIPVKALLAHAGHRPRPAPAAVAPLRGPRRAHAGRSPRTSSSIELLRDTLAA